MIRKIIVGVVIVVVAVVGYYGWQLQREAAKMARREGDR